MYGRVARQSTLTDISIITKAIKHMHNVTIGVFKDRASAERAIGGLEEIGVNLTDVSYVFADSRGNPTVTDTEGHASSTAKGAASGAGTGAVIGALAGLVVANGILPGLGTLFVAGPLAAALGFTGAAATTAAGALTGAAAGGLIGALSGLGVSASDAKIYEERVKKGGILVTAISSNPVVKNVFDENGAEEIREYKMKD